MIHYRIFFLSCLFAVSRNAAAQAQLGLRTENYAGIHSIFLNPASAAATYPLAWDLNLISGCFAAGNNILFVRDANLFTIKRYASQIGPDPALKMSFLFEGTPTLYYDFFNDKRSKFFSAVAEGMVPSFLINLESGHSWSFFAQARGQSSGFGLPHIVNGYRYQTYKADSAIRVEPFSLAAMTWAEAGLNYGYQIELDKNYISIGLTLKKLWGFTGGYIQNAGDSRFAKQFTDSVELKSIAVEAAYTQNFQNAPTQVTGSGFSADLGAVFIPNGTPTDYNLKFGLSFHDLGSIRFTDSAYWYRFEQKKVDKTIAFVDLQGVSKSDGVPDVLKDLNALLVDKQHPIPFTRSNQFSVLLPSRMHVFADYRVANLETFNQEGAFFVQGLWVQPIRAAANQVMSDAIFAITPRYESRWWSASLPISVYNWQQTRWGLSLRAAFLTIGSDYMSSLFYKGRFDGTNFYMALKINPFTVGKWAQSEKSTGSGSAKCYRF
jgi:Family of unknown function (DUF5723)